MEMESFVCYRVDYKDFNQLIQKYYGVKDYNIAADLGNGNDSTAYSGRIEKESSIDLIKETKENIDFFMSDYKDNESFWGCKFFYDLIQDLVNKEVLPEGAYLIEISW